MECDESLIIITYIVYVNMDTDCTTSSARVIHHNRSQYSCHCDRVGVSDIKHMSHGVHHLGIHYTRVCVRDFVIRNVSSLYKTV